MTTQQEKTDSVWCLDSTRAFLSTPQLSAAVDLLKPSSGVSNIEHADKSLSGFALGVTPGTTIPIVAKEISDVFVRGNDLAVTYAETSERPFSLQIYWRVTTGEQGLIVLDTILSLQTELLESFPDFSITTQLPAAEVWSLPDDDRKTHELPLALGEAKPLDGDGSDAIMLKEVSSTWSYVEMTHPEDSGECLLRQEQDGNYTVVRKLGGRFLEKGVIRRLRVRGAFLPRTNDLQLAQECRANLMLERPPLTV